MHARHLRVIVLLTLAAGAPAAASAPARIAIASGTPQSARAWAPAGTNDYETTFDQALVVKVSPADAKVRFRCATPSCTFPSQVQGEAVTRVDPSAYDVTAEHGIASIKLTVRSASVQALTVVAKLASGRSAEVRFALTAR
jgi:hypothetical protein